MVMRDYYKVSTSLIGLLVVFWPVFWYLTGFLVPALFDPRYNLTKVLSDLAQNFVTIISQPIQVVFMAIFLLAGFAIVSCKSWARKAVLVLFYLLIVIQTLFIISLLKTSTPQSYSMIFHGVLMLVYNLVVVVLLKNLKNVRQCQ